MEPFTYCKATEPGEALTEARAGAAFLAGGTTLLDLMKLNVQSPTRLVDINHLPLDRIEESEQDPGGGRNRAIPDFYVGYGDDQAKETVLEKAELITGVTLPVRDFFRRSHYLKIRDRASFEFALVSVAASLELHDGTIRTARL